MSFWKKLFGKQSHDAQQTSETTVEDTAEVDALIASLEDPSWDTRYEAIKSLERLKNGKALIPIIECVGKERNFRVRAAGLQVLEDVYHCLDDRVAATVRARWAENGIDPNDHESGFEIRANPVSSEPEQEISAHQADPFITTCLDFEYQEFKDDRWFSHFEELPRIDSLRKNDKKQEALALCLEGLNRNSDSFLFYERAAGLYDELSQPDEAEIILKEGLEKSLSKCSIAATLGDRGFEKKNYRDAIRWWITAGIMQLESEIMVDPMPFLNLAYVCQPLGLSDTEQWLFDMADRTSSQGPIRFNAEGAELRHQAARVVKTAGDDVAQHAIVEFHDRYM